MNKLKTPYEIGDIPHNYYPRPQMVRDSFINLNGKWKFSVEVKGKRSKLGDILVPFPPESEASGIERITKKGEKLIYERSFELLPQGRSLIHFGAVDCICRVYVNEREVGGHSGGYLPFTFDITQYVNSGINTLKVEVWDELSHDHAYGKQKHKRGGMWYTPVSGIWQTVWIECVPEKYIEELRITPTLDSVTIETTGGEMEKVIKVDGKEYTYCGDSFTVNIDSPRLWSPEDPFLYEFSLSSGADTVSSYFALREISVAGKNICLNGKPYFFHGLLDQGYYPDGIYLPGNENGYRDDILKMKELGFNMLRKHIKIEPDIYYYYCDKYGMAVFQDMVNNGSYNFVIDTAMPTVGIRRGLRYRTSSERKRIFTEDSEKTVNQLYNHPSVVYYTIFNEGWGQHNSTEHYRRLKALDPSRIWDTASGWFKDCESDVQSEHIYFKPIDLKSDGIHPLVLSEFGGYSCKLDEHSYNSERTYGYKTCTDCAAFTADLEALYCNEVIPMIERGLCAAVLTQLSDVEDETNGILSYDRHVTKPDAERMRAISDAIFKAFSVLTFAEK